MTQADLLKQKESLEKANQDFKSVISGFLKKQTTFITIHSPSFFWQGWISIK